MIVQKLKRDKRPNDITVNNLAGNPKIQYELNPLLDALRLDLPCCRMEMLGKARVSSFA